MYYFEFLLKSMYSLLILVLLYEFNKILVRYYVQVLDVLGLLYYIGENFDNFLLVYGLIYLDFYGVVGVIVEQVSLCGCVQELVNGLLIFLFIICNQVVIGLGMVCGVVVECSGLFDLQKQFFQSVLKQVVQQLVKSFVFGDVYDLVLICCLLGLLLLYCIEVCVLECVVIVDGQCFDVGSVYVVLVQQVQFCLVYLIFVEMLLIKGDVFYGSISYVIVLVYGVVFVGSCSCVDGGVCVIVLLVEQGVVLGGQVGFVYVIDWCDYNVGCVLVVLQGKGVSVCVVFQLFIIVIVQGEVSFVVGSLVILVVG